MSRSVQPASARAWLLAVRPRTLAAALGPVAVGTASAHTVDSASVLPALAALVSALFIQIGTNFVNDAADFERGTDNDDRLGPIRAAQAGLLSPGALWRGAAVSFGIAAALGIYLIFCGGWPIIAIGVISIIAGIGYTAGPAPLAYIGVADIAVFLFFGFVAVCGTALVQVGELGAIPNIAYWASVPVGALSTAMLAINNLRDRVGDKVAAKKTFAVRFGRKAAIVQCVILYAISFATPVFLALTYGLGDPHGYPNDHDFGAIIWPLLLPLLSLPLAFGPLRAIIGGREGAELSSALAATARLLLVFSLLFATGIALS